MDTDGNIKHDTDGMKQIAIDYYTDLFDTKSINSRIAQKLLRNIKKQITSQQKSDLDVAITLEELEKAIMWHKIEKKNQGLQPLVVYI